MARPPGAQSDMRAFTWAPLYGVGDNVRTSPLVASFDMIAPCRWLGVVSPGCIDMVGLCSPGLIGQKPTNRDSGSAGGVITPAGIVTDGAAGGGTCGGCTLVGSPHAEAPGAPCTGTPPADDPCPDAPFGACSCTDDGNVFPVIPAIPGVAGVPTGPTPLGTFGSGKDG